MARMLKRWWASSAEAEADAWLARHGFYAYRLAGDRAIDAYCLGDLDEQERWHEIRAIILDWIAPDATVEQIQLLLGPAPHFEEADPADWLLDTGSDQDG